MPDKCTQCRIFFQSHRLVLRCLLQENPGFTTVKYSLIMLFLYTRLQLRIGVGVLGEKGRFHHY